MLTVFQSDSLHFRIAVANRCIASQKTWLNVASALKHFFLTVIICTVYKAREKRMTHRMTVHQNIAFPVKDSKSCGETDMSHQIKSWLRVSLTWRKLSTWFFIRSCGTSLDSIHKISVYHQTVLTSSGVGPRSNVSERQNSCQCLLWFKRHRTININYEVRSNAAILKLFASHVKYREASILSVAVHAVSFQEQSII